MRLTCKPMFVRKFNDFFPTIICNTSHIKTASFKRLIICSQYIPFGEGFGIYLPSKRVCFSFLFTAFILIIIILNTSAAISFADFVLVMTIYEFLTSFTHINIVLQFSRHNSFTTIYEFRICI